MKLTGIIAISGKPGLYTVVAQGKSNVIVKSIETGRKMPAFATDRISALEDISIYTMEGDELLSSVYQSIYDKQNGEAALDHKSDIKELKAYLLEVLPDYDEERVHSSDIKKIFQWYNLLQKDGLLKEAVKSSVAAEEE
jgi:Ribonuclease G/E